MTRTLLFLILLSPTLATAQDEGKLFADFTVGAGWSVQVAIQNNSTKDRLTGWLLARDGDSRTLDIFGPTQPMGLFGGEAVPVSIPPNGTAVYKSLDEGDLVRGTVLILKTSETGPFEENVLSALLTYRNTESGLEVSVPPFDLDPVFFGTELAYSIFIEETSQIGTGLALWKNLDSEVCMTLFEEDGSIFETSDGRGDSSCLSDEGQHYVKTIPEYFDGWDFPDDFKGRLFIWVVDKKSGLDGVVFGQALRYSKNPEKPSLSAIPWENSNLQRSLI